MAAHVAAARRPVVGVGVDRAVQQAENTGSGGLLLLLVLLLLLEAHARDGRAPQRPVAGCTPTVSKVEAFLLLEHTSADHQPTTAAGTPAGDPAPCVVRAGGGGS